MPDPADDGSGLPDQSATGTTSDRPVPQADRITGQTLERMEDCDRARERIIELLTARNSTGRNELERRAVASDTLAKLAREDPTTLDEFLPVLAEQLRLAAEELRREADCGASSEAPDTRVALRSIRANLVETVSRLIIDTPELAVEREAFIDYVGAVTTDLDDRTLRLATRALFVSANERPEELASAAELLDEFLTYPDTVVQALGSGVVGRVAATRPDAVAASAANLRALLAHENSTVQHNAVEALAALVGSRPDTVAPVADALRNLLDHEEVAIQHNAAGVLYVLAEHHPDAVMPAIDEFRQLREHEDETVRRIAAATLARLAGNGPGATGNSKPERS